MKIVKYYDELYLANLDRQLLLDHGIPAEIFNEIALTAAFAGNSSRPYLAVPDSRYHEAMEILSAKPVDE
ncbi:MAG: hypothetical protein LUF87_09690 [Alistipes sp.]|nr:hypothetical protein [Alistipes sp.]